MNVIELSKCADALGQTDPAFERALKTALGNEITKALLNCDLSRLNILSRQHPDELRRMLQLLRDPDVLKLLKKIDKHNADILKQCRGEQEKLILALARRERTPQEKAPSRRQPGKKAASAGSGKNGASQKTRARSLGLRGIAGLPDANEREALLKALTADELRAQAKKHDLMIPPHLGKKADQVAFIASQMVKGWPSVPLSVLDDSEY